MNAVQVIERIFTVEKKISPLIFKIFASNGLDAVVLPPFVVPAPLHGQIGVSVITIIEIATLLLVLYSLECTVLSGWSHPRHDC